MYKVGLGQDSHKLDESCPLVLGGVRLGETGGFLSDSDGDVILHSLCNALSSAIGGDSLGTWSDKMCLKDGIKESTKYFEYIFERIQKGKYSVGNVSISVEMKKPVLSLDQIHKIKKNMAQLLKMKIDEIGITFSSGDNLTAFGRGEGAQVLTIVLLKND